MNLLKRIALSAFVAFSAALASFALPGVTQQIADTSGEYVFYKDTSFTRPSYIGIIYYDDSTYAFRYYSPANSKEGLSEKNITLYFAIDSTKSYLDLTGEKIDGIVTAEDADLINYLHDLFYEFTSRRQKVEFGKSTTVSVNDDFNQFGGNVTVVYNKRVPVFNIESIKAKSGKEIFSLQTTGQLVSSQDTSFSSYKGTDGLPKDKERSLKKSKNTSSVKASADGMTAAIDSDWQKAMDNMWLLGDSAVLSLTAIPSANGADQDAYRQFVIRKSIQGSDGAFSLWQYQSEKSSANKTALQTVYYRPSENSVTRSFKTLILRKDGTYACFTLTVFDGVYQKNKAYFDKIASSFSAE